MSRVVYKLQRAVVVKQPVAVSSTIAVSVERESVLHICAAGRFLMLRR